MCKAEEAAVAVAAAAAAIYNETKKKKFNYEYIYKQEENIIFIFYFLRRTKKLIPRERMCEYECACVYMREKYNIEKKNKIKTITTK
jgi:hypothetical protein